MDARGEVAVAVQAWLDENKRLEDFRLVNRDVEALLADLCHAHRATSSSEEGGSVKCTLLVDFNSGAELRWAYERQPAEGAAHVEVRIELWARLPGEEEEVHFVEFHGSRSADLSMDEAMYNVDYERVAQMQTSLVLSLPRPIVLLDLLLIFPFAEGAGGQESPVPFRLHILEDMLDQECWAEDAEPDESTARGPAEAPEASLAAASAALSLPCRGGGKRSRQ